MDNDGNAAVGRRPSHEAFWVKERDGKKGEWRQVGIAFPHSDGKGMNLVLDLMPMDGRIVLRLIEPKEVR